MRPLSYLHIHSPGDATVRVVSLSLDVMRLGRSSICEIRVQDPSLFDIEGYLRRRGRSWYLQPAATQSHLRIQDRLLDEQILLPDGMTFELGELTLEIRSDGEEGRIGQAGTFTAPIVVTAPAPLIVASLDEPPTPQASEAADRPEIATPSPALDGSAEQPVEESAAPVARPRRQPVPGSESSPAGAYERLERWRPGPRVDPPDLSGGWKPGPAPPPAAPPVKPAGWNKEPSRPAAFRSKPTSGSIPPSPALPGSSASGASWQNFKAAYPPFPASERVPFRPMPAVPPVPPRPPASTPVTTGDTWFDPDDLVGREAWESSDVQPPVEPPPPCLSTSFDGLDMERLTGSDPVEAPGAPAMLADAEPAAIPAEPESRPIESPIAPEVAASEAAEPEPPLALDARAASPDELAEPPVEVSARITRPIRDEAAGPPVPVAPSELDEKPDSLPTIAMIMQARAAQSQGEKAPQKTAARSLVPELSHTPARAPEALAIRGRWPVLPLAAISGVLTLGGLFLCVAWAQDSSAASQALRFLFATDKELADPISLDPMPRPSWWASTSDHLFERGLTLVRSREEVDRELGRDLIDLAENASPWNPTVLAFQRDQERARGSEPPRLTPTSRDILPLVALSRDAFRAREIERAISGLIDASDMALRADIAAAPVPQPAAAERSPRWLVPQEELFAPIAEALFALKEQPVDRVVERLPGYGPLFLSIARRARSARLPGADAWLKKVVELGDDPPAGGSTLVHQMARAEAHALLGHSKEARSLYEWVVEQPCPPALQACCWANLAGLYAQANDVNRMNMARQNARKLGGINMTVTSTAVPGRPAGSPSRSEFGKSKSQ